MSLVPRADRPIMFTEAIACCVVSALGTLLVRERAETKRRRADESLTRELAVELALHVAEKTPLEGDLRVPRRMVERILVLAHRLNLDPADARAAALAAALPAGARADSRLPLPDGTRAALAYRHARWDGEGVVRDVSGPQIPAPAQLLAAVDWLEARDGASRASLAEALRHEAGRTLGPRMVAALLDSLDALLTVSAAEAHLGLRVTSGAMLCIAAADPDAIPAGLRAPFLSALESRVRERVRPSDRVYCTDAEVVVWLGNTTADGAAAAAERLRPAVGRVPIPSLQRIEVATRMGVAVADSDATSFTELLAMARGRCGAAPAAARRTA